ncbi:MAG: hypothetical protein ACRECZ_00365 [Methylocella sp.]
MVEHRQLGQGGGEFRQSARLTVWRGVVDMHPQMLAAALQRFEGKLAKVGLESGPFTPHLFRSRAAMGYLMVCVDARRAAGVIKTRRIKSDKVHAWALAEMLRTGWFSPVHVKAIDSHRMKTRLGARDQLVKVKRSLGPTGARAVAPLRHKTAVAGWREEVRRGGI